MVFTVKPNIVISRCFLAPVRYNGAKISNPFAEQLKSCATLIPVCPELGIGLGTPREPVRLTGKPGALRMVQNGTGKDLTAKMVDFCERFLKDIKDIEGFLLKSKSPSCGTRDVKIFSCPAKDASLRGKGIFGQLAGEKFPLLPTESETGLMDDDTAWNFFTSIYSMADMRRTSKNLLRYSQLVDFHTKYKLILMAYSKKNLSVLGKIVANRENSDIKTSLEDYSKVFIETLSGKTTRKTHINVLMHVFGYFSSEISAEEKKDYLSLLESYRNRDIPLDTLLGISKVYIKRTGKNYLEEQQYFYPYPENLRDKSFS